MMRKKHIRAMILGLLGFVALPALAQAMGESTIQAYVAREVAVPLIKPSWGDFIIHTAPLNKLYSQRGYSALWVDENGAPNSTFESLRSAFLMADRHGLRADDYWDMELIGLHEKVQRNNKNWITFELAASEALVRYVSDLSTGRFDPMAVDTDIKYKKRNFTDFARLAQVLASSRDLVRGLDVFAPVHSRYGALMKILSQLRDLKAKGGWPELTSPGFKLQLGVSAPVIMQIRERLNQLGYPISYAGGENFDAEMDQVIREYQTKNGLGVDGIIGIRSEVLRSMNYSVSQRIGQVELTMEKLRWLPTKMEDRHIFVNLATTEFRLFDQGQMVYHFKTINGQPFRRTPSMKDSLRFVNLNPTWTVPHSIAIRDKIPALQKDPNYLAKHNMILLDAYTDKEVDPSTIDWQAMNARTFTYYFRQLPGPDNALGVVKFPLTNPWAIYMHDTNERHLFKENKRHRSSGCIRLEYPLELAAYLLRDQQGWSLQDIQAFVPMTVDQRPVELEKKVYLTTPMPVYLMYLTVEANEQGGIRFVDDVYGQDIRLARALNNKRSGSELF